MTPHPTILRSIRGADPAAPGDDPADRGSVVVALPALAVGLLALAGLVVDGGTALAARERAADVAQQAARAGADALAPDALRQGDPGQLTLDPPAAQAAGQRVLAVEGVLGQVQISGSTVTVTAQVSRRTALLSAIGIDNVTGRASQSATVVFGGSQPANQSAASGQLSASGAATVGVLAGLATPARPGATP